MLENGQEKELTQDLPDMHSQFSSSVDVVEVNDHNNVPHVEDKDNENISEKNVDKHFIHTVDIYKVDDDTEGGKEVSDGIVVGVKEVQEVDHGVAEAVGEDDPPHLLRVTWRLHSSFAPGGLFEDASLSVPEPASAWQLLYRTVSTRLLVTNTVWDTVSAK